MTRRHNHHGKDPPKKYGDIIADRLKKAGWSLGWVSAVHSEGRTIWIVDAHRGNGKRFVVRADEKLTAFMELEAAIRAVSPLNQDNLIAPRPAVGCSNWLDR